jgi:hypothetical protein
LRSSATQFGCIFVFRSVFGPVEELLAQRGLIVSYETIRQWCLTSLRGYEREKCGDSNQRNKPNAFSQPLGSSLGISSHEDIVCVKGEYRAILQDRFQQWNEVTGVKQMV